MKHRSLIVSLLGVIPATACIQPSAPHGLGKGGARLSEISMNLPEINKFSDKPELQRLITHYRFTVTPKNPGTNCTTIDRVAAWSDTKDATAQILQGCDYAISMEIGMGGAGAQPTQLPATDTVTPGTTSPAANGGAPATSPTVSPTPVASATPPVTTPTTNPSAPSGSSMPTTPVIERVEGGLGEVYYIGKKDLLAADPAFAGQPKINLVLEVFVTELGKRKGFLGLPVTILAGGASDLSVSVTVAGGGANGANSTTANTSQINAESMPKDIFDTQTARMGKGFEGYYYSRAFSILDASQEAEGFQVGRLAFPEYSSKYDFLIITKETPNCKPTALQLKSAKSLADLQNNRLKVKVKLLIKHCGTSSPKGIYATTIEEM